VTRWCFPWVGGLRWFRSAGEPSGAKRERWSPSYSRALICVGKHRRID
jgi:hypothetical protein